MPVIERVLRLEPITEQRELYEAISELRGKYKKARGIDAYLCFNEQTGQMEGSNITFATLANKFLARKGQQTITPQDGMLLDKKGKLTNGGL